MQHPSTRSYRPGTPDTILMGAVKRGEGVGDAEVLGTGSGPGSFPT